jgi:4-diphosphocytidyl-2-C-methyl-D-erythritol kinase
MPFIDKWQECIVNDFETSVFPVFPEIARIKSKLLDTGAVYAAMSGSGSSVFGLFKSEPEMVKGDFPQDYFIWKGWL